MNGPPLVLGRVVVVAAFLLGAAGSTHARAGFETPSFREQAACHQHREAGEHIQAAERCLAAYNALPDVPEALDARAVMAFDARHSFRDAYDMTGDVKHLCGEIRLMIRFLNYLERHVPAGERPYDREDAQKYLDAGREELGTRTCTERPPAQESNNKPKPEPEPEPEPTATPTPATAIDVKPAPPAIRPTLKISGWVLFGLGLGLGGWATAEMVLAEVDQRARATLIASTPGMAPGELVDRLDELDAAGRAANRRAIVAASLSGASLVTGVTLLSIDAHRRRKLRRLALSPVTGPTLGVRLRLEF